VLNLKEKLSDCLNAFKLIIWRGFERIAWAKVRSCWSSSPLPRCPIRVTGARSCRSAPPCDGAAEAWGVGRCAELLAGASDRHTVRSWATVDAAPNSAARSSVPLTQHAPRWIGAAVAVALAVALAVAVPEEQPDEQAAALDLGQQPDAAPNSSAARLRDEQFDAAVRR